MKVILAGFSKTGTKTLNVALTQLGFNVYDHMEHFWYARDEWIALMNDTGTCKPLKEIYKDVDAVCDIPACFYWDEMLKLFPEAKVILMLRDTEEQWSKSFQKQLNTDVGFKMILRLSYLGNRFYTFLSVMSTAVFSYQAPPSWCDFRISPEKGKSIYRRHNAYVLQNAPKEKLLVYNVKEGWEPLCKFLDVEEPDTPFPHKNARADLWKVAMAEHPAFQRIKREIKISLAVLGVGFASLLYWKFPAISRFASQGSALIANAIARKN